MRPKLLKSFIVVVVFWLTASTFYWSFQRPEVNLEALRALKALMPFANISVPAGEASILQSIGVQMKVLWFWSAPMLLLTALSGCLGYGVVWLLAKRTAQERTDRETGSGAYRGVTCTLGVLPSPPGLPRDEIDLGADDDGLLSAMTPPQRRVLCDVLGTMSAAPNAYAGEGITVPLLDHSLNLAAQALTHKRHPGLAAIVAAAHGLAHITVYQKDKEGRWGLMRGKSHDKESARILATFNSWNDLPVLERDAVIMAVKFNNNARVIPDLNGDPQVYRLAREILTVADDAQVVVVTEEKQRTLEKTELPDVVFDAFARALPSLAFQSRGLPKGVPAVAWKVGTRVYLLEIKLRETVMAKLPEDVRGALSPNPKERSRLQPFTAELLRALESRGWLVREINDTKVEVKDALWNLKAGKLDFKGVIVIDVPKEFMAQLPSEDSMYEIVVSGPLFNAGHGGGGHGGNGGGNGGQAPGNITRDDLLGSVLKPGAPKNNPSV